MHIKVIKGRKYYYKSIRRGKKVTSQYIGPADEVDTQMAQGKVKQEEKEEYEETQEDESYIG